MSSSIGGHTRHVHDHFLRLIDGASYCNGRKTVRYDVRERGRDVESDVGAALEEAAEIEAALMSPRFEKALANEVTVSFVFAREEDSVTGEEIEYQSNVKRELAFVTHHAVHHHAYVRRIVEEHKLEAILPPHFGMAPSTVLHQNRTEKGVK